MNEHKACNCERIQYNLVFACSGAADVGAVTDQAARRLSQEKTASMCCIAAIAAEIPDILEKATCADKIIVLDGCEKACGKKILDAGGYTGHAHVELGSIGMEKGKTPANEENIVKAVAVAREALTNHCAK